MTILKPALDDLDKEKPVFVTEWGFEPDARQHWSGTAEDYGAPFADGLLVAIEAGATAVIQPGGSVRDDEVIKAADDHGVAMVFTGTRHFRH